MGKMDLKKSINELVNILDKKLEDKNVGTNYTNIIRNRLQLSGTLVNEIKFIYEKYYAKYEDFKTKYNTYRDREEASDATIKFYSYYVALKRIGEVCQEILDKLKKKLTINEEELKGALKSAELAKTQKKFFLKIDTNKLGNNNGEIKLAEILNYSNVLKSVNSADSETWVNDIKTPFGNIDIRYFVDISNNRPNVYVYPSGKHRLHFSYKGMAKVLDECCNTAKFLSLNIAESMKKYINQKINKNIFDDDHIYDLNRIIKANTAVIYFDAPAKENAAVLCGCLLFAESCDVRNPTRGKWERMAIDKVIAEIKKTNYTNPFQTVFAGEQAQYGPSVSGGMNPSSWLITGKVDITRDFPDNRMLRVFQELHSKGITKNEDYDFFCRDTSQKKLEFNKEWYTELSSKLDFLHN